jgi:hypothetical protein
MMVDARETSKAASEIKFLIDPAVAARIRDWARANLQPDPHGSGPFGDEYQTTSLYFDTRDFDVFHRRRSHGRAKYRIRRYGDADVVFLERKLRKPGLLIKRRTVESLDRLSRLKEPRHDATWASHWFHRRLLVRRLHPVCQVSYHRIARSIECSDGRARLTLDSGLHAAPTHESRFSLDRGVPLLEHRLVLELKYRVHLPAIFRCLVEEFTLRTATASKYRLGMTALGHVAAMTEPLALTDTDASYA